MLPVRLMIHTADHYSTSFSNDPVSGEDVYDYTLANAGFSCNMQEMADVMVELYKQRRGQYGGNPTAKAVCYLLDASVFAAVQMNDKIVFNGMDFMVIGKADLAFKGSIFRLDLKEML